jgi:hypothetical protein
VTPESLVDAVLEWLKEQSDRHAVDAAIIADLAPGIIGWAMARHLASSTQASPKSRSIRHSPTFLELLGKIRSGTARAPNDIQPPFPLVDLLAICLQPNATRAFLPVARDLRRLGRETSFLVEASDITSRQLLSDGSFPVRATASLRDPGVVIGVTRGAFRLRYLWSDQLLNQLLVRLALPNFKQLTSPLQAFMRRSVLGGLVRAETATHALRQSPAKNVLFITRRALLSNILTHTHPQARRLFFLQGIVPEIPPIRTRLNVHHAFAGGPLDLPYLLRCEIPETRISLTGYPDYDRFVGLKRDACRMAYANARSLDPKRRWILFTSQYATPLFSSTARLANLEAVLRLARAWPDSQFIVKLHPRNETWEPAELPLNILVERQYPTPELMKAADAAVTYWSTTAIECLLLGTPLVQLNATGLPDFLPLPAELQVPVARSTDELSRALGFVLTDAARTPAEALERFIGPPPDGMAAERTAAAVLKEMAP